MTARNTEKHAPPAPRGYTQAFLPQGGAAHLVSPERAEKTLCGRDLDRRWIRGAPDDPRPLCRACLRAAGGRYLAPPSPWGRIHIAATGGARTLCGTPVGERWRVLDAPPAGNKKYCLRCLRRVGAGAEPPTLQIYVGWKKGRRGKPERAALVCGKQRLLFHKDRLASIPRYVQRCLKGASQARIELYYSPPVEGLARELLHMLKPEHEVRVHREKNKRIKKRLHGETPSKIEKDPRDQPSRRVYTDYSRVPGKGAAWVVVDESARVLLAVYQPESGLPPIENEIPGALLHLLVTSDPRPIASDDERLREAIARLLDGVSGDELSRRIAYVKRRANPAHEAARAFLEEAARLFKKPRR